MRGEREKRIRGREKGDSVRVETEDSGRGEIRERGENVKGER